MKDQFKLSLVNIKFNKTQYTLIQIFLGEGALNGHLIFILGFRHQPKLIFFLNLIMFGCQVSPPPPHTHTPTPTHPPPRYFEATSIYIFSAFFGVKFCFICKIGQNNTDFVY